VRPPDACAPRLAGALVTNRSGEPPFGADSRALTHLHESRLSLPRPFLPSSHERTRSSRVSASGPTPISSGRTPPLEYKTSSRFWWTNRPICIDFIHPFLYKPAELDSFEFRPLTPPPRPQEDRWASSTDSSASN